MTDTLYGFPVRRELHPRHHTVLAVILGIVHGLIRPFPDGCFVDFSWQFLVSFAGDKTNGQGGYAKALFDKTEQNTLDYLRSLIGSSLGQQDGKFVSAKPETHINFIPGAFPQNIGKVDEDFISLLVTMLVVVLLEIIDINDSQHQWIVLPMGPLHLIAEKRSSKARLFRIDVSPSCIDNRSSSRIMRRSRTARASLAASSA